MSNFLFKNRSLLIGVVIGIVGVALIGYFVAEQRVGSMQVLLEQDIADRAAYIKEAATNLARGTVSADAKSIISDCSVSERTQFENRLTKLEQTLSRTELAELQNLFNVCASVQARQHAITFMGLKEATTELVTLITYRNYLGGYTEYDEFVLVAQQIVSNEQEISALSFDQVTLQREIIEKLQAGLSVDSDDASELRTANLSLRNQLISLVTENATLRQSL